MPNGVTIRDNAVLLNLYQLGVAVKDTPNMLRVVGSYMMDSIAKTFRDEGSPAGSWPELAESTKKHKGYTAGHKLLILSGRLFGSIIPAVDGNAVRIDTGLVYAAVHQWGSLDRQGGSVGAQARLADRAVHVDEFDYLRVQKFRRYGLDQRADKNGKMRGVRVRAQGPANRIKVHVGAHDRHQNIPARPYLVFRPEDEGNIENAIGNWVMAGMKAARA
jgi:phage gpG-like protein